MLILNQYQYIKLSVCIFVTNKLGLLTVYHHI